MDDLKKNIENIENIEEIKEENKNIKVLKKRGRKPKDKSLIVEETKIPKKRGRKPKIKIISEEDKNKFILPSKRGRKPKDKNKIQNTNLFLEDMKHTILHLPIPIHILENIDNDLDEITPYDPHLVNNNIENINNISNNNSVDCIFSEVDKNTYLNQELNVIETHNNYIKTFEKCEKRVLKCNWCLHNCESDNIFKLPYEINNDIIKYYGHFCCPECAVSFNFNELNDEYVWERYSLLNYLYSNNNEKINIAPSRLLLDICGGPLNINEFKNIIKTNKYINIIIPPHYILCPQIEVKKNSDTSDLYIPLNINRVNKYTNDLKLKRNKPVSNINSLESCMNLKCI
tara:strand:+ start:518 stop:1549 length:1032 start_codon:yes stop_codon:yes gene_type:complete